MLYVVRYLKTWSKQSSYAKSTIYFSSIEVTDSSTDEHIGIPGT